MPMVSYGKILAHWHIQDGLQNVPIMFQIAHLPVYNPQLLLSTVYVSLLDVSLKQCLKDGGT